MTFGLQADKNIHIRNTHKKERWREIDSWWMLGMFEALILKNVFSSFLSFLPIKGELLTVTHNKDEEITHK